MTVTLPDADAAPGEFVLAVADKAETWARSDAAVLVPLLAAFMLQQVALWRVLAGRHVYYRGPFGRPLCAACGEEGNGCHWQRAPWICADLKAAVAACRALPPGLP